MKIFLCATLFLIPSVVMGQQPITVEGQQFENIQSLHDYITQNQPDLSAQDSYYEPYFKASALLEYAKYDPKGAREIALSEMASPHPRIAVMGLLFLDDTEIPELTDSFRTNLKCETFYWHLACIERYGSGELLPDVVKLYELHKGTWACDIADRCLGFIVKHDRARGLALVEEAVTLRAETGCYHEVLHEVLVTYPGADVLELSLKYIGDNDERVAQSAATVAYSQEGGKEKLRAILTNQPYRLSSRMRTYIELLVGAPN